MFALRVVAALTIVACAYGTDLDEAKWMLKCCKYAITTGISEAQIPMHVPLRVNKTFEYNGKMLGILGYSAKLENITWAGIPTWKLVSANQTSKDSDSIASFPFHITWDKFDINVDYDANVTEGPLTQHIFGKANMVMNKVNWTGVFYVKKATATEAAVFPKLDLQWHVDEMKCDVHGAGIFGNTIATAVRMGLKTVFDKQIMKSGIEDFIIGIMNNRWAKDGERVQKIIDYCKKNGV